MFRHLRNIGMLEVFKQLAGGLTRFFKVCGGGVKGCYRG
jgi:hypothetical protein